MHYILRPYFDAARVVVACHCRGEKQRIFICAYMREISVSRRFQKMHYKIIGYKYSRPLILEAVRMCREKREHSASSIYLWRAAKRNVNLS